MLELINDILDVAKIESGKLELEIAPVNISRLVDSSLTFIKQIAHKKNIRLSSHIPKELGEIEVDERRIRQVLINLLSNAIEFTPNGGSVIVEAKADTEVLSLSITDTGIGIAPENMSKLFKSFVQVDSSLSRRYEGTGLGLALVRRIVELHEGSVRVESELGKGSCFSVILPRLREKRAVCDRSLLVTNCVTLPTHNNIKDTQQPSRLILLAEDNEANIDTMSMSLAWGGYRLIIAKNGWEAVHLAQLHHPDLILMDIQMPEMDGLTATRQLRSDTTTATIPIIALTALAMPGDREICHNSKLLR